MLVPNLLAQVGYEADQLVQRALDLGGVRCLGVLADVAQLTKHRLDHVCLCLQHTSTIT